MAEAMEKSEGTGGSVWVPVVTAMLSGTVSGFVGYWLGKRDKPCACKLNGNGNGGGVPGGSNGNGIKNGNGGA